MCLLFKQQKKSLNLASYYRALFLEGWGWDWGGNNPLNFENKKKQPTHWKTHNQTQKLPTHHNITNAEQTLQTIFGHCGFKPCPSFWRFVHGNRKKKSRSARLLSRRPGRFMRTSRTTFTISAARLRFHPQWTCGWKWQLFGLWDGWTMCG